jgi:5-methylcytosine-specific restriction endonuclease McrA
MRAKAQPWIARLVNIETLIARFKGHCVYCGKAVAPDKTQPHPDAPSRDHFIPISRGGPRGAKNTVLACYACNQKKGNMDPRLILFMWLWLNPTSFYAAVRRFDAINHNGASIH